MLKCSITLIIQIIFQSYSFGQTLNYKPLLDSLDNHIGLFVAKEPIKEIRVCLADTTDYINYLSDVYHCKLDNKIMSQLIENRKNVDTSYWSDKELEESILLNTRDEYINIKDVLIKLKITDKKKIKLYRKIVNDFNNTTSWDKDIYYISRPVFDNTNQFAIIQYDNGHSGLGGGGSIALFHLEEGKWREIGLIEHWKY